jgi:hypothetical protein
MSMSACPPKLRGEALQRFATAARDLTDDAAMSVPWR